MQECQKIHFLESMKNMLEAYHQKTNAFMLGIWWKVCKDYDLEQVNDAIESWCINPKTGKFAPKPADVAELLQKKASKQEGLCVKPKRLEGNEAWAVALDSVDERKTVVWTDEIAQAFGCARPVLDAGDSVGARMAFLEAYRRFAQSNDAADFVPKVQVSYGWDAALRVDALRSPIAQLLLEQDVSALRLGFEGEDIASAAPASVAGERAEQLRVLRDALKQLEVEREEQRKEQRKARLNAAQRDWSERKRHARQLVEAHLWAQDKVRSCAVDASELATDG